MAEIDISQSIRSGTPFTIEPGNDYLVFWFIGIAHIDWAIYSHAPFQVNVKGLRSLFGPIPNPFDSGWMDAETPFAANAAYYGKHGGDTAISLYLVVRAAEQRVLLFTKEYSGAITIPL